MTRRRLVAVAALVMVVAAPTAGYTAYLTDQAGWQRQLCDAQTAMDANQISLGGVAVTGQDRQTLQQQYQDAAASYRQAAQHLHLDPNQLSTECSP